MKNISILGSTGSIGTQTLEVIRNYPDRFNVVALTAGKNIDKLYEQITEFRPEVVSVLDESDASRLSGMLDGTDVKVHYGTTGYNKAATLDSADMVVSSMVGASGLEPTYHAIKSGKDIALANKESLVIAGELLIGEAKISGSTIIPVDSEHSAIFQILGKDKKSFVKRLVITASGGPFRNTPESQLPGVTVDNALEHPTWNMGSKITIDSATLMNKGFEIIEAKWLFEIPIDRISVWIHPQSIVHSMVEYIDGSFISQMSLPDMKIPIAYALSYPERIGLKDFSTEPADFTDLSFDNVDQDKFSSLKLARNASNEGGTMPAVLNAANEVAVHAFLNNEIKFTEIMRIVDVTMKEHINVSASSLEEFFEADRWARSHAETIIKKTGVK